MTSSSKTPQPTITIDWNFYAQFLKDVNMTDDQKREFLEAILSIVLGFVDLGFNTHPAQLAIDDTRPSKQSCAPIGDKIASLAPDMLDLPHAQNIRAQGRNPIASAHHMRNSQPVLPNQGDMNDG